MEAGGGSGDWQGWWCSWGLRHQAAEAEAELLVIGNEGGAAGNPCPASEKTPEAHAGKTQEKHNTVHDYYTLTI